MKKGSKVAAGLNPQYIVDSNGKKTAVILDIRTFERLVDHIEGLYMGFIAAEKVSTPKQHEQDYDQSAHVQESDSFEQEA